MEQAAEAAKPSGREKRPRRGKVRPRVNVEDRVLKIAAPAGSRSKGCGSYLVQEPLVSVACGPLPARTLGHAGHRTARHYRAAARGDPGTIRR